MKRFFVLLTVTLILYTIYYDLSHGTLPAVTIEKTSLAQTKIEQPSTFFKKKVESGDTVLSIIENQLDTSLPVPIEIVVSDFEKLNHGISPNEIQIGKVYKFPNYKNH